MTMIDHALVIHRDIAQLRLASEALVMFRPGYRVATASDLPAASEWLEAIAPALVVIDGGVTDGPTLAVWWRDNRLENLSTVVMGAPPAELPEPDAIVPNPVTVPALLRAVRSATTQGRRTVTADVSQGEPAP